MTLDEWKAWWRYNGERELRDVMALWWDPVGVYGEPLATGEYDNYVLQVGRLLREDANIDQVDRYLREVEEEMMELPSSSSRSCPGVLASGAAGDAEA